METRLIEANGQEYLECLPDGWLLESERKALDLLAACAEQGTTNLLLHSESLPEAFFDLRTGLAGAVLLKFSMYRVRTAAVIPAERIGRGRFYEMVSETNRGNQFRVFQDREAAGQWLAGV